VVAYQDNIRGPNRGAIMSEESLHSESFRVERHGDIAVIIPSPEVESMHENLIQQAAQMVLAPLKEDPPSGLVIDLSRVSYFGSVFISFLLRCHMLVKKHGSEVVLAGVSERIRELLNLTALNTLWAIYSTRAEALEALGGSD
jgi:anti-sigma B factor antagonist